MKTLTDYSNPFQAILDFEQAVAEFTGAPYCVTTDCCTHAIEIAFRLTYTEGTISFPSRTYLSVPMTLRKLKIPYVFTNESWHRSYQFKGSNVYDYARCFEAKMYEPGTIQCVSFGLSKPLQIGQGGCLLTDDVEIYQEASRMRYDGRDIFNYSPWVKQKKFRLGYHYYMRPEECVIGLNLLEQKQFTLQLPKHFDYPDCNDIEIVD